MKLPEEKSKNEWIETTVTGVTGSVATDGTVEATYIDISNLEATAVRIKNAYIIDGFAVLPLPFVSGQNKVYAYSSTSRITIQNSLKYYNNKPVEFTIEYTKT